MVVSTTGWCLRGYLHDKTDTSISNQIGKEKWSGSTGMKSDLFIHFQGRSVRVNLEEVGEPIDMVTLGTTTWNSSGSFVEYVPCWLCQHQDRSTCSSPSSCLSKQQSVTGRYPGTLYYSFTNEYTICSFLFVTTCNPKIELFQYLRRGNIFMWYGSPWTLNRRQHQNPYFRKNNYNAGI